MSTNNLRLQVILQTIDRASSVLRRIQGGSSDAAKELKKTRQELDKLNAQQKIIGELRNLQAGFKKVSNELKVAKTNFDSLRASGSATAEQLKKQQAIVDKLTASWKKQKDQMMAARSRASTAGITNLTEAEQRLRQEIDRTTRSITEQKEKLKRLGAANASRQSGQATAGKMAAVGATSAFGGLAVLRGLHSPIEESKLFISETQRIAALGLGDKVTADAIKFAKGMQTYGTSTRDNVSLLKDALTVFADLHHAKMVAPTLADMKFANEAFFGAEKGGDNEKKFMDMMKVVELRGGVNSSEAFNTKADMIQRVITATGGRVQGEEWLNLVKRGGTAARGISDEALYYQMEPMVQAMSGDGVGTAMMSAYQALYQGKTTKRAANLLGDLGMITDPSKVQHDKSGQIAHIGPGALKGSDVFRRNQFEWMETVLLPQLAKKGITDSEKIKDVMGGILSNRTASNLFTTMYDLRGAIHKNAALNAGADGIQELKAKAQKMPSGNELELLARKKNAYKEFGDAVMPAYVWALETATSALKGLTIWMQENPRTARVMAIGLGIIAVGMVAIGGLMMLIAPIIIAFVFMRYVMALAGIQGTAFSLVIGKLGGLLTWLVGVLRVLGLAMLANPITLYIMGIAIAAGLIYYYWGPISQFFSQLWQTIKTIFNDGVSWVQQQGLRMYNAGADLMRGLANGITNGLGAVKDSIVGAGSAAIGWFKEKLGIHSPSRVFMAAGQNITDGAALGISSRYDRVRKATAGLSLAALGTLPLAAGAAPLRMDTRPPLSAASAGAGMAASTGPSTISITINAAPGMDVQALARAVSAELDKRERQKRASSRSSLSDLN